MEKHDCEQCDQRGKCDLEHTVTMIQMAIKDGRLEETTQYILNKGQDEPLFKFMHLTIGELRDTPKIKDFASMVLRLATPEQKPKIESMFRSMVMSYSRMLISQALAKTSEIGEALGVMALTKNGGEGTEFPDSLRDLMEMPTVGGVQ